MTLSFKPALLKLGRLGLATCLLSACHHETRQAAQTAATTRQAAQLKATGTVPPAAPPGAALPAGPPAKPDVATIDIVVGRNDTLDRIFRQLKVNRTDLAHLRSMPGIRTHMDNLRLGESLHFV